MLSRHNASRLRSHKGHNQKAYLIPTNLELSRYRYMPINISIASSIFCKMKQWTN